MQENGPHITPSGTRALVSAMLTTAVPTIPAHTATTAVDLLDAVSRAVLVDVLTLSPIEARTALATLWGQP